jgi:hypothetical protein
MLPQTWRLAITALAVIHFLPAEAARTRRQQQPESAAVRELADDTEAEFDHGLRVESRPEEPFWLKPAMMDRRVYAEVLNAHVS